MRQILLVFALQIIGCTGTVLCQTTITYLDYEATICSYEMQDGKLTGNYLSFYTNGQIKSKGTLINGQRSGHWTVWDSAGNKRMERQYINPYEFERIYPPIPNEGPIPLLMENQYPLAYDSNGMIRYYKMEVDNAIFRHKYWRRLIAKENKVLFTNNRLFNIFQQLTRTKLITAYNPVDDRFTTQLNADSLPNINTGKIAFEIKEEFTFDMNRLLSEYRILGICPMVFDQGKWQKLYWLYYPDLRPYLVKEQIHTDVQPTAIKNLDELFVRRDFASVIVKTTVNNPFDLPFEKYDHFTQCEQAAEPLMQELTIIEKENELWIQLTDNPATSSMPHHTNAN